MNEKIFKFGPDACGEVVVRHDTVCVIINDDDAGAHNYIIRPQMNTGGTMSLEVVEDDQFIYDHIELIGDVE